MNEISELIYISDPQTYELLFINESGKKAFHIDSVCGQKCYKGLCRDWITRVRSAPIRF